MQIVKHKNSILLYLLLLSTSVLSAQSIIADSLLQRGQATVYFASGKADLPLVIDSILAPVLALTQTDSPLLIDISAHTDAVGNDAANERLSQQRATTVRDHLIGLGIADSLFTLNTFGERDPIAENDTEEGRQQNRRATIQVFQKIETTTISGTVKDQKKQVGIQAEVVIHGKLFRDSFQTDTNGNWERLVPANTILGVDVFAPNYFYETKMIKTQPKLLKPIEVELPFLKPGMAIPIKHMYFYGNVAKFLPRSLPELPKLLKFMLYNDTIKIEIGGHVNVPNKPRGFESQSEFNLSVARAKAVYDYLIDHQISKDRITFKGYGNSQMIYYKNPSAKQQEMNRRVEIKVLGSDEVISKAEKLN